MAEPRDPSTPTNPPELEKLSWTCRFHPTDWFHEIGCPHVEWTKEQLQSAIESSKRKWPELRERWQAEAERLVAEKVIALEQRVRELEALEQVVLRSPSATIRIDAQSNGDLPEWQIDVLVDGEWENGEVNSYVGTTLGEAIDAARGAKQ